MLKNVVIVSLVVLVVCFAYLGIYQRQQADKFESELVLTQKAMFALEVGV